MADTETPLVSVVIATNREAPYLAEALASVAAQTHSAVQVVVVDNGVPNAAVLARTAADAGAELVTVPPPVTVSLARNVGVAHARGELVVFLDDDDVWHPERLARQIAALAADVGAPASYCGGWHLDAEGERFAPAWPATPASAVDMLAGRARMPHICGALLIRRAAFLEVGGFSAEMSMLEDFELAVRLLGRGTLACVPDELVGYRRHDGNTTDTGLRGIRVRRVALEGILRRHAWAARVRGDTALASLLDEHRAREGRRASAEAARAALTALRRGRAADALAEARWGLRTDARAFAGETARRLVTGRSSR